jgi:hypothetical protein
MQVALGVGSLVLLAGGLVAVVKRRMTPVHAASVLLIAVVVAAVALLADWLAGRLGLGGFYVAMVVLTTTVAGIAMAVAVIIRPPRRIP